MLYNIQSIENIPSIISNGLLCNDEMRKIKHKSIAIDEVQVKRDNITVTNGLRLHQYANLYFDYWNPMLSRVRDKNDDICILEVSAKILDIDGVILSDRNAASNYASFYGASYGLKFKLIDFDSVYRECWIDDDFIVAFDKKSKKCAEALVPFCIPYNYVLSAIVHSDVALQKIHFNGFSKRISIQPDSFF